MLNWIINLAPVLAVVLGWLRALFNVKLVAFLLFKAVLFFLFYKYLPFLFGRFFQWIYDLGGLVNMDIDLSPLEGFGWPAISGLAGWLYEVFQIDVCIRIMISGAIVRLSLRSIPFLGK